MTDGENGEIMLIAGPDGGFLGVVIGAAVVIIVLIVVIMIMCRRKKDRVVSVVPVAPSMAGKHAGSTMFNP